MILSSAGLELREVRVGKILIGNVAIKVEAIDSGEVLQTVGGVMLATGADLEEVSGWVDGRVVLESRNVRLDIAAPPRER